MDGDPRVLPLADAGGLAAPAAAGVSAEVSEEPEGVTLLDAAQSWEEAHKVVLEYEQNESTNRAQVSSVYTAEENPRRTRRGSRADRENSSP